MQDVQLYHISQQWPQSEFGDGSNIGTLQLLFNRVQEKANAVPYDEDNDIDTLTIVNPGEVPAEEPLTTTPTAPPIYNKFPVYIWQKWRNLGLSL